MAVNHEEILRVIRTVCTSLQVSNDDCDKELEDLGVDSLDMSGILLAIEEEYDIRIPDQDIEKLNTIDAIAIYVNQKVSQ